jgi:dienelactone hydrolase
LAVPEKAKGVILFAHGSGSSRHSPRNQSVAQALRRAGLGTLLLDLLTAQEDVTYQTRFDIELLSTRLEITTTWLAEQPLAMGMSLGYFGASTGAAAALQAAARLEHRIGAIVSRGGRPDLAQTALEQVRAPTLLIVGELDQAVIELNQQAFQKLHTEKELVIVPRAGHLFEEEGALEEVARLATGWFERHLSSTRAAAV